MHFPKILSNDFVICDPTEQIETENSPNIKFAAEGLFFLLCLRRNSNALLLCSSCLDVKLLKDENPI